jgi:hypothetical protein
MKDIENSPDDSHGNSEAVYELPDSVKECVEQNQAGQEPSTYMALKDDKEPDNVYQSLQQKEGNKTLMDYENSAFTFRSK